MAGRGFSDAAMMDDTMGPWVLIIGIGYIPKLVMNVFVVMKERSILGAGRPEAFCPGI